ncbi:MAG: MiaB/RimO family radical SAM methylthiotransferase [Candidatus Omnitrophota bacterium]|nr:MiaB/RimO family radical SAM methylthiotransferase [Candidatus Omnitrophota bacterium]
MQMKKKVTVQRSEVNQGVIPAPVFTGVNSSGKGQRGYDRMDARPRLNYSRGCFHRHDKSKERKFPEAKLLQKKSNIGILSLGCPRNLVDSENILGRLNAKGYFITDIDKADIAIVNTCGFIEDAKRESIDAILDLIELKKEGKIKKLIVCGCLSQRYKEVLKDEFPGVDAFLGRASLNHSSDRFSLTPRHYAYLKICEGCINNCSFCAIPKIKGKFTSLDVSSVLKRVEAFDREGISELNIIGQDITGYGIDLAGNVDLTVLLKKILKKIKNISWLRLLYLYPGRVSDDLLKLIRDSKEICKYIDLPIQHINSRLLKLMNRDTKKEDIIRLIERARKIIPNVALRTSIIAGFPSERDEEFKELLKFIEEVKFERLGAFIYSREEGTAAYNFKNQIPWKQKVSRFNQIMSLQQKISEEVNKRFLKKELLVLVDEKKDDYYLCRSFFDAPEVDGTVYVKSTHSAHLPAIGGVGCSGLILSGALKGQPSDRGLAPSNVSRKPLNAGDFLKVKITDTLEYDLVGEVQEDEYR